MRWGWLLWQTKANSSTTCLWNEYVIMCCRLSNPDVCVYVYACVCARLPLFTSRHWISDNLLKINMESLSATGNTDPYAHMVGLIFAQHISLIQNHLCCSRLGHDAKVSDTATVLNLLVAEIPQRRRDFIWFYVFYLHHDLSLSFFFSFSVLCCQHNHFSAVLLKLVTVLSNIHLFLWKMSVFFFLMDSFEWIKTEFLDVRTITCLSSSRCDFIYLVFCSSVFECRSHWCVKINRMYYLSKQDIFALKAVICSHLEKFN